MTTTILRRFYVPLFCLMLTGCSLSALNLPAPNKPADEEAARFAQGLDRYLESGDLTTLEQFPQQYPQGEWQPGAEGILSLVRQLRQQQALLKTKEQQLASCKQEKTALAHDIRILEETLARLKEVLIDTELQAK